MLTFPSSVRIFIYTQPADMRCGFNKLSMFANSIMGHDPFSGHLFVYFKKRGDKCKILFWDSESKETGETTAATKFLQESHLDTDKTCMSLTYAEPNSNTPGRTRTCDLRIRNPLLYPTELRALQF